MAFTLVKAKHGSDFIPRQAIAKPTAAWKSTLEMMSLLHDGDASALVSRANYICVDGNSTVAATQLFIVRIKLANANQNTSINLDGARLILRTINTAFSNCYCVIQVLDNHQFRISN